MARMITTDVNSHPLKDSILGVNLKTLPNIGVFFFQPYDFMAWFTAAKASALDSRLPKLKLWTPNSQSFSFGLQTAKAEALDSRLPKLQLWTPDWQS
jgi:hypothetical protein